jgi:hypothetical protein
MKELAMKIILYLVGGLLALVLLVFVAQIVASETGEVVVLTSEGPDGSAQTRLWVVDLNGVQYLRASPDSGWYQRLVAEPDALLERGGKRGEYRAEARLELAAEINGLMHEKYGWRDAFIELLLGGRDDAVPVALIPRS